MGYCHNIITTEDGTMGDVLDIEMMKGSVFSQNPAGTVRNIFEFESKLQRMSVVYEDRGGLRVLAKGSPEEIKRRCVKESIPFKYDNILTKYAIKGYRVIALASKEIFDP